MGRFRRLAALALIGSIVPTTLGGHRFWEETDQAARAQQRMHFLKNLGLLGGLILAALDTEGEPSLGWRAKHRVHELETAMAVGRAATSANRRRSVRKSKGASHRSGKDSDSGLRSRAHLDAHQIAGAGAAAVERVPAARDGLRNASEAAMQVLLSSGGAASDAVQQAASMAGDAARQLEPLAETVTSKGLDVVGPHLTAGARRASDALSRFGVQDAIHSNGQR